MEEEKKLYPLKFIKIDENPAEDVHIADLGYQDSLVSEGWLAANSISEVMDTYMDRVVGEAAFAWYGRQFPVLVKVIKGTEQGALMVNPDDELSAERFDFLGKAKFWYVLEAKPGSKLTIGLKRDVSAEEFYMACRHSNVEELLNTVEAKAGDHYFIHPGLIHRAGAGVVLAEIAESSPLDFEILGESELNLEAAFDFIDFGKYHPHRVEAKAEGDGAVRRLTDCKEFCVNEISLKDPIHVNAAKPGSFTIYTCLNGELSLQTTDDEGNHSYSVKAQQSILVPAETEEFNLVPAAVRTVLLETTVDRHEELDKYTNEIRQVHMGDPMLQDPFGGD